MLRAQVHRDADEDAAAVSDGLDEDEFVAVAVTESSSAEQEKDRLALRETDEQFLWMLLLAAVAECVTTCFVPGYTLRSWGLNVGGTALNWIGPFLDGVTYGYEDRLKKGTQVSLACVQFRSAFLGYASGDLRGYGAGADRAASLLLIAGSSRRTRSWSTTREISVAAALQRGLCTSARRFWEAACASDWESKRSWLRG